MGPGSNRELERESESEIMVKDSQTDGPYVVACDRETTALHFCRYPKAGLLLLGSLDTLHGTLSSRPQTAGRLHMHCSLDLALAQGPGRTSLQILELLSAYSGELSFLSTSLSIHIYHCLMYSCHFTVHKAVSYVLPPMESDTSIGR